MDFEQKIKEAIGKVMDVSTGDISLQKPKGGENFGDYAFPCFPFVKIYEKNPVQIAEDLKNKLDKLKIKEIIKIEAIGGYINFFIDKESLTRSLLGNINKPFIPKDKETILVESPGPNTNKPLHVGHIRNLFIGDSIARIFDFTGNKVKIVDVVNDRGIHICKSMLAYQKWGKNLTPEKAKKKSDHFVGDFYVLFSKKASEKPELEKEAQEILKKWEAGDKETLALWKKMNSWALDGMQETYKLLNFKHDKQYFESQTYKKGREIVLEGVKKGLFKKKGDGSVSIDLGELGEKVLLRADGTTVYITQDLYMIEARYKDYNFDKMFYVVANEQNYHFQVLFKILGILGKKWAKNCYHVSYGMVNLPSGKIKSREGTTADADDLIQDLIEDAKSELKKRHKLSKKELDLRALAIALAALKFALLKVDIKKDMIFNKQEALDFEGFSGPYLQYSYARANSILKKTKTRVKSNSSFKDLEEAEISLVKKLSEFQNILERAKKEIKPDIMALYSYELSKVFNNFYHNCPVSQIKDVGIKLRRIEIVQAFKNIISICLNLIGIETLEEM